MNKGEYTPYEIITTILLCLKAMILHLTPSEETEFGIDI